MAHQLSVAFVDCYGAEQAERHRQVDFAGLQRARMVREGDVNDLSVAPAVDTERFEIERQLCVLQRTGRYADRDRLALPFALQDRGSQRRVVGHRQVEPFPSNQDVIPPAPSANPNNVHAFADRTRQMLARRVGDVKLSLIKREQRRSAVAKVFDVVFQPVLLLDTG